MNGVGSLSHAWCGDFLLLMVFLEFQLQMVWGVPVANGVGVPVIGGVEVPVANGMGSSSCK